MSEILNVQSMLPTKFEPKRKNRFLFAIEGIDAYLVKTAKVPSLKLGEVPIHYMNDIRYLVGKHEFDTLAVTLHDPIAPSGSQQVMEWVRLHHESVSGRGGYADFYKRDIQIKLVDPIGTVISLWDGKGAFLTDVNFGELTYEGADLMEISMTIRADRWILQF